MMLETEEALELQGLRVAAKDTPTELTKLGWDRLSELEKKNLPETSGLERAVIGTGRGMLDLYQGAKQGGMQIGEKMGLVKPGTAQQYTDKTTEDIGYYDKLSEAHPWSTGVGRFAGNVASAPIPGMQGGLLARLLKTGMASGALGATEYAPEGSVGERARMGAFGLGGGLLGETAAEVGNLAKLGYRNMVPGPGDLPPGGIGPAGAGAAATAGESGARYFGRGPATPVHGIPLTHGQTTGSVKDQQLEQRVGRGAFGEGEQTKFDDFMTQQQTGVDEAYGGAQGRLGRPGQTEADSASALQSGVQRRANELWEQTGQFYEAAKKSDAGLESEDAMEMLGRLRNKTLDRFDISTEKANPLTHDALARLDDWIDAAENQAGEVLGAYDLDGMRRELNAMWKTAQGSDRANLSKLKHAYDQVLMEMVDNGRLVGDETGLLNLRQGIKHRADYGKLYGERFKRTRGGKQIADPAGKFIERLVEDTEMPVEEIASTMFGKKLGSTKLTHRVMRRVEDIAGRDSDEYGALRNIALHKLRNSVINVNSGNISPQKLVTEWNRLQSGASDLLGQIFDQNQIDEINTLVREIGRTRYDERALNRSGSAHMLENIFNTLPAVMGATAGAATGAGVPGAIGGFIGVKAIQGVGDSIKNAIAPLFTMRIYTGVGKAIPPSIGYGIGSEANRQTQQR